MLLKNCDNRLPLLMIYSFGKILLNTRPSNGRISYLKATFLFALLAGCMLSGQNYKPLIDRLEQAAQKKKADNIYIQTSKGIYETGEDLWFKAYILDNQSFKPSFKSKTLHVQLTGETNAEVVWEGKYEIDNGICEGHIYIDEGLDSGEYVLSTFTQHSVFSNDREYHSLRKIKIVQRLDEVGSSNSKRTRKVVAFDLFPEGGRLVSGVNNRIAFKAIDTLGIPVKVTGTVFEDGDRLLDFESEHHGMGSFDMNPKSQKEYHIVINGHSTDTLGRFPKIEEEGIVLRSLGQEDEQLGVHVFASPAFVGKQVFIRLQLRGTAYAMVEARLKKSLHIKIPVAEIPQGIAELTLFDATFKPLAERLVYVQRESRLNIEASLSNDGEARVKDKVTLNIKVTDPDGNPVVGNLGVSIFDQIYQNKNDPKNLMSHYYLSTQLQGKIYDPAYYFDNGNSARPLDLLLMTQGWRRYVWSEHHLSGQDPPRQAVFSDGIKGTILRKRGRQKNSLPFPTVITYNPEFENKIDFVVPDSVGVYGIGPQHLKIGESGYLYVKLTGDSKTQYTNSLKDSGFRRFKQYPFSAAYAISRITEDSSYTSFLANRKNPDLVELDEVEVNSKRKRVYREKYFGQLDSIHRALNTDYVCKYNILNCEFHANDKSNRKPVEGEVYLYMEVWDENTNSWKKGHKDIVGAKVFRNPPLPPYTFRRYTDQELLDLFGIVRIRGYYGIKEFYEPNYDIDDSSFPDYRNTLLWKPNLKTDENGEVEVDFFCSDLNTLFLGEIEGFGGDGLLGTHRFQLLVKR